MDRHRVDDLLKNMALIALQIEGHDDDLADYAAELRRHIDEIRNELADVPN